VCISYLLIKNILVLKIKSSKLLIKLKRDIKQYQSIVSSNESLSAKKNNYLMNIISKYNLENFNEIMNLEFKGYDYEIDDDELEDFKKSIDHYFSLYAPNDEEFKEFIKIISLYLTYIAKKPLHPPGIIFSNGSKVYQNMGSFVCTGKNIFIKDELSLCRYCVAIYP
jgi:uncharacterized protein (UPF0305 family)